MNFDYSQIEINSALGCLMAFKQAYKEEDGVITIGNIRDLIDKIDLIEKCVRKQKNIPADAEKHFKFFGKMEWVKYCPSCGTILHPENDQKFCSMCGQKFY